MRRPRKGLRSTRNKKKQEISETTVEIKKENESSEKHEGMNNIFCFAALADKQKGTLYTDATGALPVVSLEGNQYYFIAYDYDTNAILAEPLRSVKDADIIAAFEKIFQELKSKGYKPALNITDNQATTPLKAYLTKEDCQWQFVEPTNHRVNAAERAIQTFKNHVISELCTTDVAFPLQLWDQLTEQAIITLNLLRTSRIDPTKSAYHQLHGHRYDWNKWPMAPPGTRALLLIDPTTRESWGTRGIDAS